MYGQKAVSSIENNDIPVNNIPPPPPPPPPAPPPPPPPPASSSSRAEEARSTRATNTNSTRVVSLHCHGPSDSTILAPSSPSSAKLETLGEIIYTTLTSCGSGDDSQMPEHAKNGNESNDYKTNRDKNECRDISFSSVPNRNGDLHPPLECNRNNQEEFFPESEYQKFEKSQEEKSRNRKYRNITSIGASAIAGLGGFIVGGPVGAAIGMGLAGSGTRFAMTKNGKKSSARLKNNLMSNGQGPSKARRVYTDPGQVDPPNEKRVKLVLKWASMKIEEGGSEETLLQMFDEVLNQLAPWVVRAERKPKEAKRMIAHFGRFMDQAKIYTHFRLSNRAWMARWEQDMVDAEEARNRFLYILPILREMRDVLQPDGHTSPRMCAPANPVSMKKGIDSSNTGNTFRSLDHIKDWVDDTLDRSSVRHFIEYGIRRETLVSSSEKPIVEDKFEDHDSEELSKGSLAHADGEGGGNWELPPAGAEDEMDDHESICSDEFFDVQEPPSCDDVSLSGFQKCCGDHSNEEHQWAQPTDHPWKVRGKNYLRDRIKVDSEAQFSQLIAVDLCFSETEVKQMTEHAKSAYAIFRSQGNTDFLFVVNWRCPPMHVVCVFAIKNPSEMPLLQKFRKMSYEERKQRVKVIPQCIEGPWLARTAIGTTPVIIGKKLETDFYSGEDFLEISINVFSSSAAKKMMSVVCTACRKMVIDVAIILEGQTEDELPERVIGSFRVIRTNINRLRPL